MSQRSFLFPAVGDLPPAPYLRRRRAKEFNPLYDTSQGQELTTAF